MSSYRSEASGIAAIFYIILKICTYYEITSGLVICYCDSKGVLNNVYKKRRRGITPFLTTDYDLFHLYHTLLADIPIEIRGEWVKGHHYPCQMEPKYEINHLADANATKFSSSPAPSFTPRKLPLSYPGFRIQIHYDSSIITSNLYQTLSSSLHDQPLIDHITKKASWSPSIFASVDWTTNGRAFCRLTTFCRIGTSNLIHGLAHTSHRNNLFYGMTNNCPICSQEVETFQHVLLCMHPDMRQHRTDALRILSEQLSTIHTPQQIKESILHGFHCWSNEVSSSHPCSLVAGSTRSPDIVLTSAFHEQYHTLSWFQFCLGRISKKWAAPARGYMPSIDAPLWSSLLVSILWGLLELSGASATN
jgi:hypothetical protein